MKKRFTRIMAAMMLLVTFAIPMGMRGQTTYEQLTSIANIDESAQYVLGIDGTGFHYEGTSSWGKTALPSAQTPIYYTLTKATDGNSFTAHATISGTTYYLQIPTSNTFSMATSTGTNTDIIIGTTQVSGTNYAVANKTTTTRHLRINGTSGLRSYASTTGTMAFFYKVVTSSSNTYTVTFDAGDGTFVGNTDFPNTSNTVIAGTYDLPSATPETGYIFDGWLATGSTTPVTGSYTVSGDVDFTASYSENSGTNQTLTFDVSSNPGGWPTTNSTTLTNYTYNLDDVDYTFALKNVKCNNGYLMMTSTAVLGLPALEGYKLTKVVAKNSSGCSTSTKVGISSSASEASYITGGEIQTWSTTGSSYTYNLTSTEENTMYYLYVTNKNAQVIELALTYEAAAANPAIATTTTITVPSDFNTDLHNGTTAGTLTATVAANGSAISGATVTWSSSNTSVATIDANGAVTLVAVGTTTITASYAGVTDQYRPSSATYSLEVTDSTPVLEATFIFNTDEGLQDLGITKPEAGDEDGTNLEAGHDYVIGIVTMNVTHGGTHTRIWRLSDGTTELRAYKTSTLTFSVPSGYAVKKVTFTGSALPYSELTNGVWTSTGEPVSTITFNCTGTAKVNTITVEYEENASVVDAPTLPASVNFLNQMSVTITNNAQGATVYYTTDGSDPKTSSTRVEYTQAFTVNATTTVKAIACKNSNYSQVVEATYTLVDVLTTMQAVFDAAGEETNVFVNFNNYVVSGVSTNGKNVFVTDNNGNGFVIFNNNGDLNQTYSVGSSLSGTAVPCNLVKYNGFAELLNVDASNLTITTGGTVSTSNIAMADLAGINTGALVSYQILTCSVDDSGDTPKYYLTDGTTTLQVYNSLYAFEALEDGATYRITGIYQQFNNTKEILPRSVADIEKGSTYTLPITAADFDSNPATGYYFIASPVSENIAPSETNGITSGNYDLYFWDEPAHTWRNYKQNSAGTNTSAGFKIENGKGYLYANEEGTTISFTGTPLTETSKNITLSKQNTETAHGAWNLIGNPFTEAAYLYDANGRNRAYYIMKPNGSDVIPAELGDAVAKMNGIFVIADAHNEVVTFSTTAPTNNGKFLALNINQNRGDVIDRAIVNFNEGSELPKLQLFESTKLYIKQNDEDYAVVNGQNQGTLPINFKATANGTYTLNIDTENVEFSTLILHDNLTGEDINLLSRATYSFDATTEDDANRFTLVYSKDGEDTTETLTFYDGDTSSSYVPVYGFYADAYQKVEFIMPTDDLSELNGGTINKMTWYLTTPAEAAWGGNFKIYLMETEATTPENYADLTNATLVYDGPLDGTGETLEINFATGFLYEGDNLLVAVHQTETGTYKSATFAGSAVTGAALQGYNYSSLDQVNQNVRDFLPKTTFEFTPSSGAVYYKPKQLQASEIGLTSAVLTWVAGDDETSWGVEYRKVTEDTWTDAGTVDQLTITLDNLEAGTEYEAHVKSIYTDGESGWTTIAFATEACEETDKGEVAYSLTDTYGDGWNNNKLRIFLSGTDIMIAELTITTGSELEGVVKLCYDTDYDLVWVAGNYAYETGFVLTAPDGTIIYEYHGTGSSGGTTPTPGVLTTFQIHNGFTKTIKAYTDNSGYYLIASPVGNVLASNVTNMVDGNYDLYMFDQTGDDEGKQWLNYKANAFSYLEVGMGYLYASESDVTLTFSGTPISSDDDYAVEVNYNASSDFPGLNLLGNPFAEEAYLVNAEGNGLAYHRLNPANNTYVTVDDNSAIPMMEGVFYEAGENDVVVYFSATAPATSKSNLNITVSQGRGMVDNAIVRFGEGNTLRKISLRDNSTKVYIPQNGSEYALVNANEFGEMPVNFKAESNGTYTMSFSNQNVEFGYLHLIDNLTGTDVDLLANPSYSFEAKVSDYASRFKLVFATGNDDSSSDFAFVSNDEIIVNGEGMLQVIDMTGRIISTSQVNGMSSIKLNAASGVYVLRLNDKTQKIVIR